MIKVRKSSNNDFCYKLLSLKNNKKYEKSNFDIFYEVVENNIVIGLIKVNGVAFETWFDSFRAKKAAFSSTLIEEHMYRLNS